MIKLNPHIHFNGNTEEAFDFYQSAIGGELRGIMRFKDLQTEGFSFPEEELHKIMHISLVLNDVVLLTGSDVPSMLGVVSESENRSKINLHAESREEAEKSSRHCPWVLKWNFHWEKALGVLILRHLEISMGSSG